MLLGLLALMLVAVGTFVGLYFRFVSVPRVAAYHVPPGARFAARLDLQQIALFAPIREHVVPVLLQRRGQPPDQKGQLERIEASTGINLGMDVMELVVVQRRGALGAVVAGRLPDEGVAAGILEYLGPDNDRGCTLRGERLCCRAPELCLEQASDGALVIATNAALLEAMLPSSDGYQELGLEPEGPGSFGGSLADFDLRGVPVLGTSSALAVAANVARVEGKIRLEQEVTLRIEAVPRPGTSLSGLPERLESVRTALTTAALFAPGQDIAGERALLARLRFGTEGARVTAEAEWQRHEIEQAARSLGAVLGAFLGAQ